MSRIVVRPKKLGLKIGLGALVLLVALLIYAFRSLLALSDESNGRSREAFLKIAQPWNSSALQSYSSGRWTPSQLDSVVARAQQRYGKLISYKVMPTSLSTTKIGGPSGISTANVVIAEFEKGSAWVNLEWKRIGGSWKLVNFGFDSKGQRLEPGKE